MISSARKANELDVVELLEDLPEYGVSRGARGTVLEIFEAPEEAYMVEFVDDSGTSSRIADWVRPNQIVNTFDIAREAYERGMTLFNAGEPDEAEPELEKAISLNPNYARILHDLLLKSLPNPADYSNAIGILRFVVRIAPEYQTARNNLAIAYLNYAIERAEKGDDSEVAIEFLDIGLSIGPEEKVARDIRWNLAVAYTLLGSKAYSEQDYDRSLILMRLACEMDVNDVTRHNLSFALASDGWCHLQTGNLDRAITSFQSALYAAPAESVFLRSAILSDYGVALARSGRIDQARNAIAKSLRLSPGNDTIKSNLRALDTTLDSLVVQPMEESLISKPPMRPGSMHLAA